MNPTLPSFLSSMRLQAFMQATQDIRFGQLPVWAGRVPNVNATDDEIFAKVENYADAADIVLDGGKAVVSAPDKLKIVTTTLANIKRGQRINQSTMNLLVRLTSGVATRGDQVTFDTYLANTMRKRRLACEIRRAWLVCGMVAETGLAYDRLGVKLSGVDFGAPSGLKVTLAGANKWDAPTTSDGIKDIVELARTARTEYGENYNRVTMSTSAFLKLTAQDSFKARAQSLQAGSLGSVAVPLATDDVLRTVIGRLVGMTVEIDDAAKSIQVITHAIAISVELVRVRGGHAVVAGITHAIAVAIELVRIRVGHAIVAGIAHAVAVAVELVSVRSSHAVVTGIAHAIAVAVELIRVRGGHAVVAGITYAITVSICLARVGNQGAVILRVAHAITVTIGQGRAHTIAADAPGVIGRAGVVIVACGSWHGRTAEYTVAINRQEVEADMAKRPDIDGGIVANLEDPVPVRIAGVEAAERNLRRIVARDIV